jgi:acylphosphatase
MIKHVSIHITGRVQGVHYRASAQREAQRLGLTGFVRNEDDGSVYLEAEGDDGTLQQLVDWCHHGPPLAQVQSVHVIEGTVKGFPDFRISRGF